MERGQNARRAAVLGLVLVLLALTAVSVAGAAETRRSANAVTASTLIADAFNRAKNAVAREELSEQHYRLEPDQETRSAHREASAALEDALADVQRWGSARDHDVAAEVLDLHVGYLAAIRALFDAVEGAGHVEALRALGCDVAQGYHYARPMPAADLKQWMAAQHLTGHAAVELQADLRS